MSQTLSAKPGAAERNGLAVNDVHSRLNHTVVNSLVRPRSLIQLLAIVQAAIRQNQSVSIAGGRHAMGGQQFLRRGVLLDMTCLNRVLSFDRAAGTITVESGLCWTELFRELEELQPGNFAWTFRQKQTGADHLSIGGALSSNIHGRGLSFRPFVQDILSFDLITASGQIARCSRRENPELFRLAIGGYGLFGVVYAVTLKLAPRQKLRRTVRLVDVEQLMDRFRERIASGCLYGDFQFAIDPDSDDFLRRGVLSCYQPVPSDTPIPSTQKILSAAQWEHLLFLAHSDKKAAFEKYAEHYQGTDGQVYWSDAHQFTQYVDGYHDTLDRKLRRCCPGSEMISELYLPRAALPSFMHEAAQCARASGWNIIYGTVRLIERDEETFLAWAREPWACVVFNICVAHSEEGQERARRAFRTLIDIAISKSGSYYLTYHPWATAAQISACHPRIREFFVRKLQYDPEEIFRSDWYDRSRSLVAESLAQPGHSASF